MKREEMSCTTSQLSGRGHSYTKNEGSAAPAPPASLTVAKTAVATTATKKNKVAALFIARKMIIR